MLKSRATKSCKDTILAVHEIESEFPKSLKEIEQNIPKTFEHLFYEQSLCWVHKTRASPTTARMPAPKVATFLEADPVNVDEVEEEPGALVPEGRMGEPVADDPDPDPDPDPMPVPELPDGAAKPVEAAPPVAITNPDEPITPEELRKVLANIRMP